MGTKWKGSVCSMARESVLLLWRARSYKAEVLGAPWTETSADLMAGGFQGWVSGQQRLVMGVAWLQHQDTGGTPASISFCYPHRSRGGHCQGHLSILCGSVSGSFLSTLNTYVCFPSLTLLMPRSPTLLTDNGDFEMNINEILEIPKFLNSNSK